MAIVMKCPSFVALSRSPSSLSRPRFLVVCLLHLRLFLLVFFFAAPVTGSGSGAEESGDLVNPDLSDSFSAFCETETFHATCSVDEVIVITQALYGRMRISRCVKLDYGHLGCVADVKELADSRCSGRRRCEIRIPDSEFAKFKPCPDDLKPYLEIGYTCIKVQTSKDFCVYPGTNAVSSPHGGFLSSLVTELTGCGGLITPWTITASPGQTVRLTLHDFGLTRAGKRHHPRPPHAPCQTYAIIREPAGAAAGSSADSGLRSPRNVTVCGGVTRQSIVYVTSGNRLEVGIIRNDHLIHGPYYVFEYRAVGCPDLTTMPNSWFSRSGDSLTIKCNFSKEVYQWKCRDNRWTGDSWNCSVAGVASNIEKLSNSGISISYGISLLMILIIALTIGIFVLAAGLVFLKRRNERSRIVMATRNQATNGSSSDKQYYSASLVRNLAGSIVLQSDKLPWTRDDACDPHSSRGYTSCSTVDKSLRSPLLSGPRISPGISPGISPPPYCHSRRRLPCGCEAYVDVAPVAPDLSTSGQDHNEGTSSTIYYVLDPQKHASHRSRNQLTTTSTSGTRTRAPEEDGGDGQEANRLRSLVHHQRADGLLPVEADVEAVAPSRYPEVVSDCEQSIQNEGQVQYGSTL